eukprot:6215122-Amphidinium_carterae.1
MALGVMCGVSDRLKVILSWSQVGEHSVGSKCVFSLSQEAKALLFDLRLFIQSPKSPGYFNAYLEGR